MFEPVSTLATSSSNLSDWPAILTLIVFILTNVVVIFPFHIPLPRRLVVSARRALVALRILSRRSDAETRRRMKIPVDLNTAPFAAVLLLLAVGATSGTDVRRGVLGADGVKPIDIMALFISLAYLSISLDAAGLFRFLAFWAARKGGKEGRRLYAYLYAWFLVCGVIVGNDPVILSGTAFLAYFTRISGIVPPTAWIYAQFSAANMASAVLVSSNPTNLVLSGAFSISFITYTSRLILPVLVSSLAIYPVLLYLFRKPGLIPRTIDLSLSDAEVRATLVDKKGAVFGSVLVLVTLGLLVGTSTIHVPVYYVTVPPAALMLLRDAVYDWTHHHTRPDPPRTPEAAASEIPMQTLPKDAPNTPVPSSNLPKSKASLHAILHHYKQQLNNRFPTVSTVASRLPVTLVPFAFLMFVLVQSLASKGWVELLARGWAAWVRETGVVGSVFGMGVLSCVFCNVCGTNIGATILLARVLQVHFASLSQSSASDKDPSRTRAGLGAIYALALGSNYGAFTATFSASLAGLLWRDILRQKGIAVRQAQFATVNAPIVILAVTVGCAVLVGEVYAW